MKTASRSALLLALLLPLLLSFIISCNRSLILSEPSHSASAPSSSPAASNTYQIVFNRQPVNTIFRPPSQEHIDNEQPDLPLEAILEAIGASYRLSQDGETLSIRQLNQEIAALQLNNEIANRGGYEVNLLEKPLRQDGKTWLSSQAIIRLLGIDQIEWNETSRAYEIYAFPAELEAIPALEQAAIQQMQRYFKLLEQSNTQTIDPQTWSSVLTANALANQTEQLLSSAGVPQSVEIIRVQPLTTSDTLEQGSVKVTVSYDTDYMPNRLARTRWESNGVAKTRYQASYLLKAENGQIRIDSVLSQQSNRSPLGAPIPFPNEAEFAQIAQNWKQQNIQPYADLTGEFSLNTLSPILTKARRGDRGALAQVSNAVQQSQDWQKFLRLQEDKDPIFSFVEATSTPGAITGTLVGNWQTDSVNFTPIVLEVKLTQQGNTWHFTGIANPRLYDNAQALSRQEPQLYQKIAAQYVYRTTTRVGWLLL